MPAHSTTGSVGRKLKGDGLAVQVHDAAGNDLIDGLAKQAARRDVLPRGRVREVREAAARFARRS
eukprot:6064488-Alexandrium_andersonii.AAC.1